MLNRRASNKESDNRNNNRYDCSDCGNLLPINRIVQFMIVVYVTSPFACYCNILDYVSLRPRAPSKTKPFKRFKSIGQTTDSLRVGCHIDFALVQNP